jgi:hypothetical protein
MVLSLSYPGWVSRPAFFFGRRVDSGGWTVWLTNTTQTQAGYAGQPGHAYTFPSTGSGQGRRGQRRGLGRG